MQGVFKKLQKLQGKCWTSSAVEEEAKFQEGQSMRGPRTDETKNRIEIGANLLQFMDDEHLAFISLFGFLLVQKKI